MSGPPYTLDKTSPWAPPPLPPPPDKSAPPNTPEQDKNSKKCKEQQQGLKKLFPPSVKGGRGGGGIEGSRDECDAVSTVYNVQYLIDSDEMDKHCYICL